MNNNKKIWFIQIQGKKEGPFSVRELKYDPRINPDTLVWKKGFNLWLPIRKVPELKKIFEDEVAALSDLKDPLRKVKAIHGKEALVLDTQKDFPPLLFLLIIILLVLVFIYRTMKFA